MGLEEKRRRTRVRGKEGGREKKSEGGRNRGRRKGGRNLAYVAFRLAKNALAW